jgi:hypothetical protein
VQDNHHYADPQCGTPFYSLNSSPFDPNRIGFQGEFGGIGLRPADAKYVQGHLSVPLPPPPPQSFLPSIRLILTTHPSLTLHDSLWPVPEAVATINQTYELHEGADSFHYRAHVLLGLLRDQVERWACSGAVYTQTTDVEGEVNGLMTYDRRVVRVDQDRWRQDIAALYRAAKARA